MQNQTSVPKPADNKKKLMLGIVGGLGCLGMILVVVAGLLIYYVSNQRAANEGNAAKGLENIADAQQNFKYVKRNNRYGTIDDLFGAQQLNGYGDYLRHSSHGYQLQMTASANSFQAIARPKSWFDGNRTFFVSTDGAVREGEPVASSTTINSNSPASSPSPPPISSPRINNETLSEDDKHKLFQAAGICGDEVLLTKVMKKLKLFTTDGAVSEEYPQFLKDHAEWGKNNGDFITRYGDKEKATAYVVAQLGE